MSDENLLRDLSNRLGLTFESQDWGIVNSDPCRLWEFIHFYESEALTATQRFELGELIIASANERLMGDVDELNEGIQTFIDFIKAHKDEQSVHITYWSSLEADEEFPVAAVLRTIGP